MRVLPLFLACLAALAPALGLAASPLIPETIGAHAVTWHSRAGFCNVNPGAYAIWGNGLTAGAYRNSECAWSAYLGHTWHADTGPVRWSLTGGGVVGYRAMPVTPMILPSAGVGPVRLFYIPRLRKTGAHAFHVALEWRL